MKEFKGTKGEWKVKILRYIAGEIFVMVEDIQIVRIALNNYTYKKKALRNAKLIAAAPELLKALQELKQHVILNGGKWEEKQPLSLYDNVDNAINKALNDE